MKALTERLELNMADESHRREFVEILGDMPTTETGEMLMAEKGWPKAFAILADGVWLFGSEAELDRFEDDLHG